MNYLYSLHLLRNSLFAILFDKKSRSRFTKNPCRSTLLTSLTKVKLALDFCLVFLSSITSKGVRVASNGGWVGFGPFWIVTSSEVYLSRFPDVTAGIKNIMFILDGSMQ